MGIPCDALCDKSATVRMTSDTGVKTHSCDKHADDALHALRHFGIIKVTLLDTKITTNWGANESEE